MSEKLTSFKEKVGSVRRIEDYVRKVTIVKSMD